MPASPADIAFSDAVKDVQQRRGSRAIYENMEMGDRIDPDLRLFISEVRSFYLATANREGRPYIQHRGGPPGFLRVIDDQTLAFADFRGNRQYITTGNLSDNAQAFLFLMDYAHRQRIKIWGSARVIDDDPELLARLKPPEYRARAEQVILFTVAAWDANCPQHIPQMFHADDVSRALADRDQRIAELEALVSELRGEEQSLPLDGRS
jgi:predicted pyridoxine 5'-phosphate oxidase superfamily flavin-nucleotide-binding protein